MPQSPLEARFWNKVNKDGPIPAHCPELGPCWIWTGKTNGFGYGLSWKRPIERRAHRVSWEIHFGAIPIGMLILHKCDNPPCVNPSHLFIGTKLDNAQDALRKGRLAPQAETLKRLWRDKWNKSMVGQNAPHAKLTEAQVLEIRTLYQPHIYSTAMLGRQFGVSQSTVHEIVTHKTWRHLKEAVSPVAGGTAT